jgi:Kef-type K+ transport system membrane component KefB
VSVPESGGAGTVPDYALLVARTKLGRRCAERPASLVGTANDDVLVGSGGGDVIQGAFLVPIFFVLMGIQVRLEAFADLSVLGVAAGLTIAAIIGKQVCGLGVLEKGVDRLSVGIGMIPRGEVGLTFASIGKGLKVIDDATFSAVVIMVIVTTLVAPPILKLTLSRKVERLESTADRR